MLAVNKCQTAVLALAVLITPIPARSQISGPQPLLVDGKPIDPRCLFPTADQSGEATRIDLNSCQEDGTETREDPKPDLIGFSLVNKDHPDWTSGAFYYRYVGQHGGRAILYTEYSGGGTGYFSKLVSLKRTGKSSFVFNTIDGGDRCSGAISNAKVVKGHLYYDKVLTPADMVDFDKSPSEDSVWEGLDYSATSCVAKAHMRDAHMMSLTLEGANSATDKELLGADQSGVPRACFEKVYRLFDQEHETELDRKKLKSFRAQFRTCVARG